MKRLLYLLIVPVVVVLAYLAWSRYAGDRNQAARVNESSASKQARVDVVAPAPRVFSGPAQVEAAERIDVVAKISGYLHSLGKDEAGREIDTGSRLQPGQVLAVLSVPEMEKELDLKKANLKEARAQETAAVQRQVQAEKELRKYSAEDRYWEEELARYEDLFKRGSIEKSLLDTKRNLREAAGAGLEGADAKVALVKADLLVAQARIDTAKFDVERSAELLKYATILAPQPTVKDSKQAPSKAAQPSAVYVVARRWLDPGAFVQPGMTNGNTLLSLIRVDTVKVVVEVTELDAARVELGDSAVLQPMALPGQSFTGKVSRFSSALDTQTRSMRVEIDLRNPDAKPLYPGMYGTVTIKLAEKKGILAVPSRCLHRDDKAGCFVWCVVDHKAVKAPVTAGVDNGSLVEVLSGLQPTSQVVRQVFGTLKDGDTVTVNKGS